MLESMEYDYSNPKWIIKHSCPILVNIPLKNIKPKLKTESGWCNFLRKSQTTDTLLVSKKYTKYNPYRFLIDQNHNILLGEGAGIIHYDLGLVLTQLGLIKNWEELKTLALGVVYFFDNQITVEISFVYGYTETIYEQTEKSEIVRVTDEVLIPLIKTWSEGVSFDLIINNPERKFQL